MWHLQHLSGGHPKAEQIKNVEHVREKMQSSHCLTVKLIANKLAMKSKRVVRSVQKWYLDCWMKGERSGVCKFVKKF